MAAMMSRALDFSPLAIGAAAVAEPGAAAAQVTADWLDGGSVALRAWEPQLPGRLERPAS